MGDSAASAAAPASVEVLTLGFGYPGAQRYSLQDIGLALPRGTRCLLCGANGAGKSTLLQVLGGKYMVNRDAVKVNGRPPFHDTKLTSSGELAFLGTTWRRSVGCAGNNVAMAADVTAEVMLSGIEGADDARRRRLIELLDIDLGWSLMHVSDGQRRRVQIAMGLLRPYDVLLLDEITVDLDVVGRLDLLDFLREECETRGCTVVYATHIFDGLEGWVTHLAYVENGRMKRYGAVEEFLPPPADGAGPPAKLLDVVEDWLAEEKETRKSCGVVELELMNTGVGGAASAAGGRFAMPSKHMSYYR